VDKESLEFQLNFILDKYGLNDNHQLRVHIDRDIRSIDSQWH